LHDRGISGQEIALVMEVAEIPVASWPLEDPAAQAGAPQTAQK
jgi:hypothetical protein